VRLLAYFGETQEPAPGAGAYRCGNCDNCLNPPATWNATEAARKALSCIYRFGQQGGASYGAGHLIDVLRGKVTDKVQQRGHERLSTFGIGAEVSEAQWRGVLRQLIALGHLRAEGEYGTLALTPSAREVLRGEVELLLRVPAEPALRSKIGARGGRGARGKADRPPPVPLDDTGLALFAELKAWRAEVAREHGLPAYVIFHDATLAEMARERPGSLDDLAGISGVGAKKLQAYGQEILRVLGRTV
jgi:ATP-dependent DNA helicase RecQ